MEIQTAIFLNASSSIFAVDTLNTVVLGRFSILKPWGFSVIFGHLGWHGCAKSGSSWFERRVNDGGFDGRRDPGYGTSLESIWVEFIGLL